VVGGSQVQSHPELHRETLFQEKKNNSEPGEAVWLRNPSNLKAELQGSPGPGIVNDPLQDSTVK
jgi:hypothetical protein